MPDGEIYDPRDDGGADTPFGYLMIKSEDNQRIKPVFKVFLQTDLTRGKKAGTKVEFVVFGTADVSINTSNESELPLIEDSINLPIAIVTSIISEPPSS